MKLKFLLTAFLVLVVFISCEKDDTNANGTGIVNFSLQELVEVENTTNALAINIGIDNYNHAEGTIAVEITGGDYGTDYVTSGGGASFNLDVAANSLISTFTLTPVDDELIEQNKVLTITLTSVTGGLELGENTTLTFTILDNDDPLIALVAFENAASQIQENDTNSTIINIPFDQASTSGGSITIESSGDAIYGTDYTIDGQSSGNFELTVPAGATSASFAIQPIDNTNFESNKTASFTIAEVSGGLSIGVISQTDITIVNDDASPNPVIDFDALNTLTYNEDAGTATINFTISSATTVDATVELTTSGTADSNDFNFGGTTANPYSFVIPSGSTSGNVSINIVDDTDTEADETIVLNISSVTGGLDAGVTLQTQTLTITDNDAVAPFNYVEDFESNDGSATYLNDVLNYQNVLATQTIDPTRLIGLITSAGSFSDVDNVNSSSDNGLNIFYNTGNDSSLNGVLDNVVITPVLEGVGNIDVSLDVAYAFKSQNTATVTFYWSQTYNGSGTFNESDWNVMGTETAADMFTNDGLGNNTYKREMFNINPTANFYIAIRVNQVVDDTNYRLRWRFDNIKALSQ